MDDFNVVPCQRVDGALFLRTKVRPLKRNVPFSLKNQSFGEGGGWEGEIQ